VGVNVYVIDSGILTTHQALSGRAFDDYDAVRDQYDPMTCNGHGTGVAGVVGSSNFGVARNVLLHSVRVFPCTGDASLSDVVSAVDWVTRHAVKPAVVNMSLRASFSQTLNSAVSASIRSGVTYVVAAGNDEADACNYSPGSVGEVITVGSTNSVDQRVYYSNFGSCVDLFAPGEGVATIWNSTDTTTTYASGTSFASPNAAGVAALYLEMNPGATPAEVQAALVNNASSGVIYNLGNTSPNLLLFSDFVGSAPTPTPSPSPSPSPSPLPSPSPAPISCVGSEFRGSLSSTGSFAYQSSKTGFAARQGILSGSLNVPVGSNFRLYLEKKSGGNRDGFTTILSSTGGSSTETVTYRAKNGTYRWRIESQAGSGAYSLCTQTP